ncbi:MAG: valine--tRNA ligase [Actinomycetota bacterium]|nr:valine--tRNA ligase [Actinomycetota bacterium]
MSSPDAADMPKAYDPAPAEARWYAAWEESGAFRPEVNPDGEPFCIVIPPPNITGSLHMGHAFEHSLIDATIRRKRMQGSAALWLPGTDHAGIATQNVVERELAKEGLDRHEIGREAFVDRVWRWKETSGGQITQQMRKMGSSCDWSRERFTMDDGCSRAVRVVFVRLYEEGLVYRANRIINWCPRCHTALSDIEVEHEDTDGELVHIRYPFKEGDGFITVATTRAETMLGDTAVAVHPSDPRYADAVGRTLVLPLVGREIPVIADEAVDPDFGTGVVKVTPAHDPNDFEIAGRHNLSPVDIFTESAVVNEAGGRFAGLARYAAREAVKQALAEEGLLDHVEVHRHAIGHCYRCHTVVEPRLSLQWFVKSRPLAVPAIEAVKEDRTQFVPERWETLYFNWMENLRDWCVSRQIWWGHRIPAWYCRDCGTVIVSVEDPTQCHGCASSDLVQDEDVLDTWFSSALWPFTTLGWPDQTPDLARFYPNAMLHTGFDIIYFWVARMMQMGLQFMGDVPFREVAIHGLVRDAEGRKMSKSFGNVVDPLEMAGRYGADALRFAMVRAASPGHDVPLAEEWVQGGRNFVNKLWNAARFVALNLDGQPLTSLDASRNDGELPLPERWILSRLAQVTAAVDEGFERYDFAEGVQKLQAFVWSEFCDWYLELAKRPLAAGGQGRAQAQRVLSAVLSGILRLLHPAIPFVTEELWHRLGGAGLVATASWPAADRSRIDEAADDSMASVIDIVSAIRRFRSEHKVAPSTRLAAFVVPADAAQRQALTDLTAQLSTLAGLESLDLVEAREPQPGEQRLVAAGATIVLPLAGVVDVVAVRADLERQVERHGKELDKIDAKLADPGFLSKAPEHVVAEMRRRQAAEQEAIATLRAQRDQLHGD